MAKSGTSGRLRQRSIKYSPSIRHGFSSQLSHRRNIIIRHKSEDLRQQRPTSISIAYTDLEIRSRAVPDMDVRNS
ncbi:hypothetical protein [Pontibacter litorisediminis]|uniref:hypothetical protein n=1 Tax=Pontibacter litorisediminis TaxID=1846260 RepID=UPI0023EC7DF4|nr:hypothetical protein [Pontibacter litorisediminis]